ncbi:MAG: chromosomal replication initiator DnaA [Alphaproteobacteria bacterium]|nr:chromosomal replication initiator DnaA [Alphaproteobacteria bacterium]MBV9692413.1 chromosomal replication initiator DnaA [Alphaproteobacteria bacterium]
MTEVIVAHVYDVPLEEMRARTRGGPRAALARQVAMYLSHIVLGMSVTDVAAAFRRHRSTAHHALHHIEELRDDPEIDRTLRFLEGMLVQAVEVRP